VLRHRIEDLMPRKSAEKKPAAGRIVETDLYAPVKAFLEKQGYTVKAEIGRCDVVARRGDEPPVIVELKNVLNLSLLLQGVERLSASDTVYLAVPNAGAALADRRVHKLLRRIGLGLLVVYPPNRRGQLVEALLDPLPYAPRKNKRRAGRLLAEFARRTGDPNTGGTAGRIKLVTAYRQEALRMASVLAARGAQKLSILKTSAEAPLAPRIVRDNVYGWFERMERGIYTLTPAGAAALRTYADKFAPPACLATAA
jgi:hypothetical protein